MFKSYLTTMMRHVLKYKGTTAINVMGLAVGMACCVLIMLYVKDELSFDHHHQKKDRIYRLAESATIASNPIEVATTPAPWGPVLAEDYPEIEQFTRIFKPPTSRWLIRYNEMRFYEQDFVFADSSVFDVFTVPLIQGNSNSALAQPNTVVISESMGDKYFGDENPIGKVLICDDELEFAVTGIMRDMPLNSHYRFDFLASYVSLVSNKLYDEPSSMQTQGLNHNVYTYLLLKETASPGDLENALPRFLEEYLGEQLRAAGIDARPYLQPLTDIHLHSNLELEFQANSDIRYVYIFSSLAFFVLLIACINFMNLSTARSANRAQEVGIKKVLGADRIKLIKQFTGETVVLSIIALLVALGLVHLLLPLFNLMTGKTVTVDYMATWLVPTLVAISVFTGVFAGGYPAFFLSSFRPVSVLTGALKSGTSNPLIRKILITFQFVVSITMIVGTVVVFSQLEYMQDKDLGFDKNQVVIVRMPDSEAISGYSAYKNAVLQYPEIVSVSSSSNVPGGQPRMTLVQPEGFEEEQSPVYQIIRADFDFIETLDIKLVSGRSFSREFATDSTACLINETALRRLGWDNAVGRTFRITMLSDDYPPYEVIGVMADFHNQSLHQPIEPLLVLFSDPGSFLQIRIQGEEPTREIGILKEQWQRTFPNHPDMDYYFLDQDLDQLYQSEQRLGSIFVAAAILSIFIACLGLLGLSSFIAEQRTKEIGIRKVLGASVTSIIQLLTLDITKLVLLAFVIGTSLSYYGLHRWLEEFPYRIELSLWGFILAGCTALLIAWLTVGYQAFKAATGNPTIALQSK